MEGISYLQQLSAKKRTYEDLSRFIAARTGGAPNYTMLLGAGCSVSSNVRSGESLVKQWRQVVYSRLCPDGPRDEASVKEYLAKNQGSWYNPHREYSSLFEKNFDLPRQRRMFVEQEVADKSPNLGYAYLIKLIEDGYLNTLFTTNFDDLINEAFFQFSHTRPIVCAHDSAISSVTVTSKRPKIIKLHGDYLFDDIKTTVRETESLEDNTRKKFIEFGRDFGLIVVGYGGGDRSIMDVLQYLLRSDDYFKNGVYWCIRKGEDPGDDLLKLLWRDRVYFVEIDGFDELMASLHNDLVGEALPVDTSIITNRPRSIITGFCKNSFLNDSPSLIIKRDLDRLRRQDEREQLLSLFRDMRNKAADDDAPGRDDLDDAELTKLVEVKQLIGSSDFEAARSRIAAEIEAKPSKNLLEKLLDLRVTLEEKAGDMNAAIAAIDELIAGDPQESSNYLRKSHLIINQVDRIKVLDIAESVDPSDHRVYNRKVECYVEAYDAGLEYDKQDVLSCIERNIAKSLEFEPGARNRIWTIATHFYANGSLAKDLVKKRLDDIVAKSSALGSNRMISLRARLERLAKYKEEHKSQAADVLIRDIIDWKLRASKSMQVDYEWLELDAYSQLQRKEDLSKRLSELDLNQDLAKDRNFLRRKSDFLISVNGDLNASIGALRQAVQAEKLREDIMRLAQLLEFSRDGDGLRSLTDTYGAQLNALDRIYIKQSECVARGDLEAGLSQLRSSFTKRFVGSAERNAEIHDLILLKRYDEASGIAKGILELVKWNKLEYGDLIVNFELAQSRSGQAMNKGRLKDLSDITLNDWVKGCALYLIGEHEKSREIFKSELRQSRENAFVFPRWAIFADDRGRTFIDSVVASVH